MRSFPKTPGRKRPWRPNGCSHTAFFGIGRLVVVLAAVSLFSQPLRAESVAAWSRRPYAIDVRIAFDPQAFSERFQSEVIAEILHSIQKSVGPSWNFELNVSGPSDPATPQELDQLLPPEPLDADVDQRYWLVISRSGGRYEVRSRSFVGAVRRMTIVAFLETADRRMLAQSATKLLLSQFQPLLVITSVQAEQVELQLRAGEFPLPDPGQPWIAPGALLQPFFVYRDKQGAVRQIQILPWTFLTVDQSTPLEVKATLQTGVRSALGTSRRRNVELLAIVVRTELPGTTYRLHPRGAARRPLVAHPVVVRKSPHEVPKAEGVEQQPMKLLSDRLGRVFVSQDSQSPLVWLQVYSGDQLLARVPAVPGSSEEETLELPDDSLRLSVEGDIELLKGRLVDAVARRATLIGRIRRLARENDWKSVDALLPELDKLPNVKSFDAEINAIRAPAMETAQKNKDRLTEARIRQLTTDAHELVVRYLENDKLIALKEELNELRSLDKQNNPAPKN